MINERAVELTMSTTYARPGCCWSSLRPNPFFLIFAVRWCIPRLRHACSIIPTEASRVWSTL